MTNVQMERKQRADALRLEAARERRCMGIDSERRAAELEQQAQALLAAVDTASQNIPANHVVVVGSQHGQLSVRTRPFSDVVRRGV